MSSMSSFGPSLRSTLLSFRDLSATVGPFVLVTLLLLALAYWLLDPTPPRRVVLATGIEQGAYAEFGRRYAELLKQHGIQVELRPTQGAAENLALLQSRDSGVDLAFVQGGAADESHAEPQDDGLMSLGSLFYEPVWLFYRKGKAQQRLGSEHIDSLRQLAGWSVQIGSPGSGVPNLMRKLIEANRLEPDSLTLLQQPQTPAVVDFLEGSSDAIVFASAPESIMVQMLLQTPGIGLFDFTQAEAYARRLPFLSPVTLPRGVVDLAGDVPAADLRLVAPTASLVARKGLHPALVQLFVQAARSVHGKPGWFQHKFDFPNSKSTEWPLSSEAARFYENGPPFLQKYLPFWLANLIDRMGVALVAIVTLLIPLSRVVPPLYQFRIRSRVFRWYGQLRALENAAGLRPTDALLAELARIETRVAGVVVPLSYSDELYSLRSHIDMVRKKLRASEVPATEEVG